jgi:peptidoglycan/LPS O-acetylase OafA/YrhL
VTRSSSYRADIQGLRAIAVLLVLLFHFETRLKGGYLGVDMFFVISGFVIASSTMREVASTNTFSWSAFLHRRVRRLLPGMAVVAVTTSVFAMLFLSPFGPQKETAKMLLSAASYTTNFVLMPQSYFSLDPKANPLLHMWSLAVEEQFYFVWPIAIIVFIDLRKRIHAQVFKVIVWTALTVALLASCWLFLMSATRGSQVTEYRWFRPLIQRSIKPEHFAFYSPFTRAWEFIAGVVAALLIRQRIVSHALRAGSLFTCCGAALVMLGVAWATKFPEVQHAATWSTNTLATVSVVIGTALWVFGGSNDKFLKRLISIRPLTLIGDYSYSIYLLHWPIWVLLITSFKQSNTVVAIAFALSLGLGWLQFRFVEEPIRLKNSFPSAKSLQFVGAFGLVAVVGFAAMSVATPITAMHLAGKKPDELTLHIIEKPCEGEQFELGSAQSCVFLSENNQAAAFLVGDSMAKSLSDGFVQAANTQGLNGYVFSFPGCAFQLSDSPFTPSNECSDWRADVFTALQELQPKILIVANLSSIYVDPPLPGWNTEETQRIWGSEVTRMLKGLKDLDTQVIIAQPPPRFAYDLRYDLSLLWPNTVKEPRGVVVSRRESINAIEQNAAAGFSFVRPIVNFTDQFCNASICDPKIDGKFMLEDDDHLSVDGSRLIIPQLQAAIASALGRVSGAAIER